MKSLIDEIVEKYYNLLLNDRRWLHAHPELSGGEERSAAYIADVLRSIGLQPTERVGGYGVVAVIEGARPGKCVALRADFDALPVTEQTNLPFASATPGVCHACGHDAHAAMLLGAARVLNDMRSVFSGTVKLIFQPSEENAADSGAKRMIADGVLKQPAVDAIIGQHMNPQFPTGMISVQPGAITAASDRFFITIQGKSSHAAKPELGVDAISIGAQVISALQSIISRNVSPMDSAVITIGKIIGGSSYNSIAETCEMEGTCRNLNPKVRDEMPQRMEQIIRGIAEGMGAKYSFRYIHGYSPVINSQELYQIAHRAAVELVGADHVCTQPPALGGEDFCFYTEQVPGIFYRLGCQKEGAPFWPLHNGHFDPDEQSLKIGCRMLVTTALDYLKAL